MKNIKIQGVEDSETKNFCFKRHFRDFSRLETKKLLRERNHVIFIEIKADKLEMWKAHI